jgi:FMN phosphatase YigB (HAD superfamily)
MQRYDAILFDVDDTLLDFRASEEAAYVIESLVELPALLYAPSAPDLRIAG